MPSMAAPKTVGKSLAMSGPDKAISIARLLSISGHSPKAPFERRTRKQA